MAIFFWLLIIIFTLLITYFLIKNNFNSETIEIIFPAIGAILFSVYLGIKYIYIDSPPPEISRFNIVLLHDVNNGHINPLTKPISIEPIRYSFIFRGLKKINEYQKPGFFSSSNVWDGLKSNKVEAVDHALTSLIEYAFFDWFSESYTHVGFNDLGAFDSISGTSYQGSPSSLELVSIKVSKQENEWNPFLKEKDIEIKLPKGSKIYRSKTDDLRLEFKLITPHSTLSIRSPGGSSGQFGGSREPLQKNIRSTFNYPEVTFHLQEHSINIELETKQRNIYRFSNQAKIEHKWLLRIKELLEKDFSWTELSKLYE